MGILRRNKTYDRRNVTPITPEELEEEQKFYYNLSKYKTATPTGEEKQEIEERQSDKSNLVKSVQ